MCRGGRGECSCSQFFSRTVVLSQLCVKDILLGLVTALFYLHLCTRMVVLLRRCVTPRPCDYL